MTENLPNLRVNTNTQVQEVRGHQSNQPKEEQTMTHNNSTIKIQRL
jgi:hypothetical protein